MPKLAFTHVGVFLKKGVPLRLVNRIQALWPEVKVYHLKLSEGIKKKTDLVISLGGDGTLLRAVTLFPGVGINYGNLGFLTAASDSELEHGITRLKQGKYFLEERPLLEVHHKKHCYYIFNEIVLKSISKVVDVELLVDGLRINTLRGDGVIVGTATGSTAYLLALGNPIVSPTIECMMISGLNVHSLSRHSIILDTKHVLTLRLRTLHAQDQAFLIPDGGKALPLSEGAEILIKRSKKSAPLLFFSKQHFFTALQEKLNYGTCEPGKKA